MRRYSMTQAVLAEIRRGNVVESWHIGSVAVCDPTGILVASYGDAAMVTFLRSSAKPFQTLPLIISGAADHFRFSDSEIAIACGSHNGEPIHTQTVDRMLNKIGIPESALLCGTHEALNKLMADEQKRAGHPARLLHNNCSGKHAGMLALAKHLGAPIETYMSPRHAVQCRVTEQVSTFSGVSQHRLATAIDGCGVPTFAMSLASIALMFARLVSPPASFEDDTRSACERICRSMINHPEMVSGDGELDTELMRALRGSLICKGGAEGMWCAAIPPNSRWQHGIGVSLKIADGSQRARGAVALAILEQLGLLEENSSRRLKSLFQQPIRNHRGDVVGSIQPVAKLVFL